ncbi:MAG TPA: hypothetical protein VHA37_03160, partial [Candidatus Saccharimonadales bacterium]|nr:hypothetical protein [Candidatus Saccharimonadales bacterium]
MLDDTGEIRSDYTPPRQAIPTTVVQAPQAPTLSGWQPADDAQPITLSPATPAQPKSSSGLWGTVG